jgi:predicted dehydrogenase
MEDPFMKSKAGKQVRYAVAGLGHLAQVAVLPAFRHASDSQLVALISDDPKKQTKLARQYGVENVYRYRDYEKCFSDGVDSVYIVLPNHLHREFTVRALDAGAHVLCEKPMAVTARDCQAMIRASERNQRKLMIAYRLHFERSNLAAIDIAQGGKLGNLRFFGSEFAQQVVRDNVRLTEKVERGGGPVYDMGVYCINAARYLFRSEPTHVFASSARVDRIRFRNTEEMSSVVLKFPEERLATFTVSFGAADVGRYTLAGTKGVLTSDPAYEYAEGNHLSVTVDGKTSKKSFPKRDQFAAEISYFSDCILHNREPEPAGREGMADVRIVEAIYRSARTGKMIALPPYSKRRRPSLQQEIRRRPHGMPSTIHVTSPSGEAA